MAHDERQPLIEEDNRGKMTFHRERFEIVICYSSVRLVYVLQTALIPIAALQPLHKLFSYTWLTERLTERAETCDLPKGEASLKMLFIISGYFDSRFYD